MTQREAEVRRQQKAVTEARNAVQDEIAQGIRKEREKIAVEETKKARLLVSDELQGRLRKASAADPDHLHEQLKKAQDEYAKLVRELEVK